MPGKLEDGLATRAGRLFAAYRDGDEAVMADLVRTLTPILWHTVRAVRLDTAAAEDVLQTVWLTLVRKADTISRSVGPSWPQFQLRLSELPSRLSSPLASLCLCE